MRFMLAKIKVNFLISSAKTTALDKEQTDLEQDLTMALQCSTLYFSCISGILNHEQPSCPAAAA